MTGIDRYMIYKLFMKKAHFDLKYWNDGDRECVINILYRSAYATSKGRVW